MTDVCNGTTTYGYNNADEVNSVSTPVPGTPAVRRSHDNVSDSMMRATNVMQPDGTTVNSEYLLTGELGLQYGSRTYPVAYSYDYAGRMAAMTNWTSFAGERVWPATRVTQWNYDSQRGFLTSKTYDDGTGPSYTYTPPGGWPARAWARGVTTTYLYDPAGSLTNISYSDTTPGVTNSYDRLARLVSVLAGGMTDTLGYNLANELLGESFSGGALNGLSVTNGYDQYLRRTNLTRSGSSPSSDPNHLRLRQCLAAGQRVTDGNNNSADVFYLANSPLVGQIMFTSKAARRA